MKIGIITDCLKRTTLEESFMDAKLVGASGVQIYATTGIFSPQTLTEELKKKHKIALQKHGLEVSALCGDMGGFGFEIEKDNEERIEKTKAIIDLALEFGANIVTSHIGVIPEDENHPRYKVMLDALTKCGVYAKSKGAFMAIETGPENAQILKGFIDKTKGGIGVNLDPANFVMVTGQNPTEAVYLLRDYIVHTHVKDGIMINKSQKAADVYHAFAVGGVDALNAIKGFKEVPIGQGDVNWDDYLKALKDIGYDGYLTLEREAGDSPFEDIKQGITFINEKLKRQTK